MVFRRRPDPIGRSIVVVTGIAMMSAHAATPNVDEEVTVVERSGSLVGIADNATEGVVGKRQLAARPLSRVGEALESVPGVVLTQHSGSGKANQYFLRGFNLDHGTDFAVSIDGMPVNMPTHGHGQGYADLNFLIPEMIDTVRYRKGPYYAEGGDFSAAGVAHIDYRRGFERNTAEISVGHYDFYRGLFAGSTSAMAGTVAAAADLQFGNGPWDLPEETRRYSAVARYSVGDARDGWHVTGMAYSNRWQSSDQIPQRAVEQGLVSRFGFVDPSDGGRTHRYSASGSWHRADDAGETHASAYFIDYGLNLYSNFTFLLDDPVDGDQFEQEDRRRVYGGQAHRHRFHTLFGRESQSTAGLQLRFDDIASVGLFHTRARQRLGVTRQDAVEQLSVSPYLENRTQWLPWLRSVLGLRGDWYHFKVDADNPLNGGSASDGLASPKLSVVFGPWADTEFSVSFGYGFHSNDARGTTLRVEPTSGDAADSVDALVRAKGVEVGLRNSSLRGLHATLTAFLLDLDSELLFIGDAGNTEASRPSRRYGLEWANYYTPLRWLSFDADLSFSRAEFRDEDPVGRYIPGAIEQVVAAGATIHDLGGVFGALRLRYFGSRPLVEDDSVRSSATLLLNGELGYEFRSGWRVALSAFNLLDSEAHDIDYFYASRLPGEPAAGVEDVHFHPVEPRQLRLVLSASF